jgi:hypothetical protein
MELTKEEFNNKFRETLDNLMQNMAENSEVNVESFYNMACILENLAFFSPVVYDLLQKPKK